MRSRADRPARADDPRADAPLADDPLDPATPPPEPPPATLSALARATALGVLGLAMSGAFVFGQCYPLSTLDMFSEPWTQASVVVAVPAGDLHAEATSPLAWRRWACAEGLPSAEAAQCDGGHAEQERRLYDRLDRAPTSAPGARGVWLVRRVLRVPEGRPGAPLEESRCVLARCAAVRGAAP